jgi:hypothetical protein
VHSTLAVENGWPSLVSRTRNAGRSAGSLYFIDFRAGAVETGHSIDTVSAGLTSQSMAAYRNVFWTLEPVAAPKNWRGRELPTRIYRPGTCSCDDGGI